MALGARLALRTAALLTTLAASGSAFALSQPDGTPIPQGAGLQGLFDMRGESIDALAAASAVPETFQPGCNLTFTVLQRNAGYQNAFGWYNVTGSAPTLADLHEFIKCSDPLNTVVPLPNIVNDPAYLGGQIGFYEGVVTGGCTPTSGPANYAYVFYSEKAYNPDSSQQNPFYHLLTYNSTVTPNAFYFGWEDLISGGDNDFDDLTTFVTGITCSGGGGACQTGALGVCGAGTLQCQNGVLQCVQLEQPEPETCDGFDNDCNGVADDGDLCSAGEVCDDGNCVPNCGSGEFQCPGDKVCDAAKGLCVSPACLGVDCPDGTQCVDGMCVEPCDGAVCPAGETCIAGSCVDPCDFIQCDPTQVCSGGACIEKCDCAGCPAGQACQPTGLCLFDACVGASCPPGTTCQADGTCKDDCDGVVCPAGQVCTAGECVDDGNGSGGGAQGGAGPGLTTSSSGGGASGTGGTSANGGGGSGAGAGGGGSDDGCNCETSGGSDGPRFGGLFALAAAGLALGRRRRLRV
jgi:MYXO-CTERM domain-containing protein